MGILTEKYIKHGVTFAVVATILFASLWYTMRSGILVSRESFKYLAHYLGQRTIIEKIFDFRGNDGLPDNGYRPRDLGNVFNYLDSEMVLLVIKFGIQGLVSPMHYVGLLCFVLIHMYFTKKYFGASVFLVALLTLLIFLTSPGSFLTGNYMRTSKIIVSVFITLIFWLVVGIVRKQIVQTKTLSQILFALSIGMALTDEVGIAFVCGFVIVTVLLFFISKSAYSIHLAIPFVVAICVVFVYRYMIGPLIVYTITDIWPHVWGVDLKNLFRVRILFGTVITFFRYIGLLIGNVGIPTAGIVYLVFLMVLIQKGSVQKTKSSHVKQYKWPIVYLVVSACCIGAIWFMAATHSPILSPVNMLRYYPIPFHAFMTAAICLGLCDIYAQIPTLRRLTTALLSIVVILNIIALPSHINAIEKKAQSENWGNAKEIVDYVFSQDLIPTQSSDPNHWDVLAIPVLRSRLGK